MTHASDAGEWLLFLGKEVLESKGGWPTAARSSRLLSILRRRICVAAEVENNEGCQREAFVTGITW